MASTIKVKRSAVQGKAPTTGNLETGEIALNTRDGRLYSKGTQVFEVGANTHSVFVGTGGATFANGAFSLPTSDGSADQVIKTNGSGVLSWVDQSGGSSSTQTMDFYDYNGALDTITITGSSFSFYDSTGTLDEISLGNSININSLSDVTITSPSSGQVLKYNGSSWVNGTDAGGASWAALTSTNTAIRTLVGQNLANTNAYIASVSATERSALANTNAYIATKVSSSNPSFTGTFQVTGPTSGNGEIYLTDGDNTGLGNSLLIKKAGSEAYINNRSAGALNFWTNNGSRVVIDSIGRTKIGDGLGPNYLLDVVTSDGDSVVQVKTAGTDATDDTIIRNVIGGTSAKNYINFGDSADDDIGGIIYDHGTDALSINVNASEQMRISSSGIVTKPNHPMFRVRPSTNPAHGTTDTKIALNTEAFDVGSNFDTSNYRFVAPVAGKYWFTYSTLIQVGSGTGNYVRAWFYKNGSAYSDGLGDNGTYGAYQRLTISDSIDLAANDYVEVYAMGATSGAFTYGSYTWLAGFLIG